MRIFLRTGMVKRYFPCLPRHISSLLVFLFLFASIGSMAASVFLWPSVAEAQGSEKAILHRNHPLVREAIEVQHRHLNQLMGIPDVVGSGVGIGSDGLPAIKVFTARHGVKGIPEWLESTPVHVEVTGRFYALRGQTCDVYDPLDYDGVCTPDERWPLPVPIGVSVGHPAITAGTIAARVTDGTTVYILSNNHVLANVNQATPGDLILQPGTYDGGTPDDEIGHLTAFKPIKFCTVWWFWLMCNETNTIDAAIAESDPGKLGFSTPPKELSSVPGYGAPSSTLHPAYGDPNILGDEELEQLLNPEVQVQKYGRTTGLTFGTISTIDATVDVCYDDACQSIARFTDQLTVTGNFSGAGDSGSLVVDSQRRPIGLLFAGTETLTVLNRIDLVLNQFGVTIDEGGITQPVIDVAVRDIDVPTPVVVGQPEPVPVTVTVENRGQESVTGVMVKLDDLTEGGTVEPPQVQIDFKPDDPNPKELYFQWTPTTVGSHTLEASLIDFHDEVEANNSISTTVMVKDQAIPTSVHIADLDGKGSKGWIWTATVTITVEDDLGKPVPNAVVHGTFSDGPSDFWCTTDQSGTCSVVGYQWVSLYKCLTYTVTGVDALLPYVNADNRDPDGGNSNGTSITVCRNSKVF